MGIPLDDDEFILSAVETDTQFPSRKKTHPGSSLPGCVNFMSKPFNGQAEESVRQLVARTTSWSCWSATAASWCRSTAASWSCWVVNLVGYNLLNHLANLNLDFLFLWLAHSCCVLVLFLNCNVLSNLYSSLFFNCLADSCCVLVLFWNCNVLSNLYSSLFFNGLADSCCVLVLFWNGDLLADLHCAFLLNGLADSCCVLVLFWNSYVLSDLHGTFLFNWLTDSCCVCVRLFNLLLFVAGVRNFCFNHVSNPDLHGLCATVAACSNSTASAGYTATATGRSNCTAAA